MYSQHKHIPQYIKPFKINLEPNNFPKWVKFYKFFNFVNSTRLLTTKAYHNCTISTIMVHWFLATNLPKSPKGSRSRLLATKAYHDINGSYQSWFLATKANHDPPLPSMLYLSQNPKRITYLATECQERNMVTHHVRS